MIWLLCAHSIYITWVYAVFTQRSRMSFTSLYRGPDCVGQEGEQEGVGVIKKNNDGTSLLVYWHFG